MAFSDLPGEARARHSQTLLKLMAIELVMPSNHLILCRVSGPPLTPKLPSLIHLLEMLLDPLLDFHLGSPGSRRSPGEVNGYPLQYSWAFLVAQMVKNVPCAWRGGARPGSRVTGGNISPSNERSGLISFRMDWLDLLAVQGTLKSLIQHHS